MTQRQSRIFELILVISIAFLPAIVYSLSLILTGTTDQRDTTGLIPTYLNGIVHAILSITLMFYVIHKQEKTISDIGLSLRFEWSDLWHAIGLIFLAGILRVLIAGPISAIFPDFLQIAENPKNIGFIDTNYMPFLVIYMIFIPLQEELIVRGFTMKSVFDLTESKTLAVLISVLVQFSYHLYQGLIPALMLLPFFIVLAIYFIRYGNLKPVILAHILTDLIFLLYKQ